MTLDSLWVALRALLANRLRSGLTMLGILMGTASVRAGDRRPGSGWDRRSPDPAHA
jgi:hypothetical protein